MMNHKLWATAVNLILVCTIDKDWKSVIFVSSLCFQKNAIHVGWKLKHVLQLLFCTIVLLFSICI